MNVPATLTRFAKSREKALKARVLFSGKVAEAVTKVRKRADWIVNMTPAQQLAHVRNIEAEILLLLPSELSKFAKQRREILQLLTLAKS